MVTIPGNCILYLSNLTSDLLVMITSRQRQYRHLVAKAHTVGKRAVCILLECFLVSQVFVCLSIWVCLHVNGPMFSFTV